MCKFRNLTWSLFGILLLSVACKEEKKSLAYDPEKPVELMRFMPDSGSIRTQFVIKGTNFGNDKSKVRVFFNDESGAEREALVLGVSPNSIYTQVPKQAGGESRIRVTVDNLEATNSNPEKTFKYIVTSSVSTVVGKAKEGGNVDGSLGETTFSTPRYVAVDNEQNIFVFDVPRSRLSSTVQNKTITLYTAGAFDQPIFLDKERNKLFAVGDQGGLGCFLFDSNTSWVSELYGYLLEPAGYMHSVTFFPANEDGTPTEGSYIVYRRNTGALYTQKFKKGMRYSPDSGNVRQIGTVFTAGSNGLCAYNPVDKYVYCVLHTPSAIYRYKLKMGEDGWPALDGEVEHYIDNGGGYADGNIDEAKFFAPHGLAIDRDGNIYVADTSNHCIRKIDIHAKTVTTVAGIPGSKGYKDGDPLESQFNNPWGVFLDKDDILYIADEQNHCIRKLAIE